MFEKTFTQYNEKNVMYLVHLSEITSRVWQIETDLVLIQKYRGLEKAKKTKITTQKFAYNCVLKCL